MTNKQHGGRRAGPPTKVVRLPVMLADMAHDLAAAKNPGEVAAFLDVESRSALRVPTMAWVGDVRVSVTGRGLCRPASRL
jgi:hypothetical protein